MQYDVQYKQDFLIDKCNPCALPLRLHTIWTIWATILTVDVRCLSPGTYQLTRRGKNLRVSKVLSLIVQTARLSYPFRHSCISDAD